MAKGPNSSRANANNRANQMNSNNAAYWSSRGVPAGGEATPTSTTPVPTDSVADAQGKK